MPEPLVFHAAVEIQAAAGDSKRPTVSILAYSGGTMRVGGYGQVVIDLAGLDMPDSIPLLADHDASLGGVIGSGTPSNDKRRLTITGTLVPNDQAAQIVQLSKSNVPLSASVGVEPMKSKWLRDGESVTVNGQTITAGSTGLRLVTKGRLRETSIVVVGADRNATTHIAAKEGGDIMPQNQNPNQNQPAQAGDIRAAAIREERERIGRIDKLCTGPQAGWDAQLQPQVAALRASAVAGDIDEHQLSDRLVTLLRDARPGAPAIHSSGPIHATADVLAASVLGLLGRESLAEKEYGERTTQQARDMHAMTLLDVFKAAVTGEGGYIGRNHADLIRAGLSTFTMPVALGNAANKVLLDAYRESPATWQAFCNVRSVKDFKDATAVRASAMQALDQVGPGGELKHTTLSEGTYTFSVDTYGRILTVSRQDIINDDLGLFADNSAAFGRSAARSVADLVYSTLLANAGSFFSSGHANLITGATSVLGSDSLETAITDMLTQRDGDGNDLDIRPKTLLVPPELSTTAKELLVSEFIARANDEPTGNAFRQVVALEIEPRLSNSDRFTSSSTTAWYLFAATTDAPMIVAFLQGRQTPTVEFFGFDKDPKTLAATWRVYHDYGCVLGDYRAAVKSAGA